MQAFDVIVIGSGPAGIFAALELVEKSDLKVLLLEKGRSIQQRYCPAKVGHRCVHCNPCAVLSGWGGAGAFSDGKLTLTTEFGGWLDLYMDKQHVAELIDYVDGIYLRFGAPTEVFGEDPAVMRQLQREAATADLTLIPARIRHLGTDNCLQILGRLEKYLLERMEIRFNCPVDQILVEEGAVTGVRLADGEEIAAKHVICGPGREGSEWFVGETKRLQLQTAVNQVDIGVRVEVPAVVMEHLTARIYESKLVYYSKSFDDRVRTFCMNPFGEVVTENNAGIITVNGHSYAEKCSENTNFALLVSKTFTEPFNEPIAYGKSIAKLANMLGGGAIVQRLGDLLSGRRSTDERIRRGMVIPTLKDATPGDLSLVLPYRHLMSIVEMLEALDKMAPGVNSRHTLLYGVEVKFYSSRLELTEELETKIQDLFGAGDGAGVTRGLAQASASGVVIARAILARQ